MNTKVNALITKALHGKLLVVPLYGTSYQTFYQVRHYTNGRIAIELDERNGTNFATLTCNLPDEELGDWEILVKTWSENEEIAKAALASGRFKDTGRRVSTGFMLAHVWEVL